jgi:hypothetical protein
MPAAARLEAFAESLAPVEACLNDESARALLALPPNPRVQARVDELAEKCNEGQLTPAESSEYDALIWADHFLGILQAKAQHYLDTHGAA